MEQRATIRGKPSVRSRANSPPLPHTLPDLRAPDRLKRLVAGYELFEEIGAGGMGVVYKARQLALDRVVALKMLRLGGAARDDFARFRAEAEAVGRLAHPGIVQIYEVGESDGQPFFSLEYVAGGSLDRRLDGKPLPAAAAARLVRELANTMQFAHGRGIVHRDLKPANVLLSDTTYTTYESYRSYEPKIADFGLAKRLDVAGTTLTGEVVGTPSYMSPEQAVGARDIGPATDIWSLGAILYECLTGRPPFLGGSAFETVEQVRKLDAVAPRTLCPTVPRDLETVALKCLEKNPLRRYRSAAELAEDLGRYLDGRPVLARPVCPWERAAKWARRRPTAAALLAVSALLVLVLATAVPLHIRHLQRSVKEERRAVEHAHERKRLTDLKFTCVQKLSDGRDALALGTPRDAERAMVSFATAQESIGDADAALCPELRALREQAAKLRAAASNELERLLGATAARSRARRFLRLRDEAFFQLYHDALGVGDAARPRAAHDACRLALERFPELDCLPSAEAARLRAARHEVFLLLAEATVRLDGSASRLRSALAVLDRADDAPRHGVHLRRARYLDQLGERAAALRERELARSAAPSVALDWFVRGQDRLLAGEAGAAIAELDLALAADPELFWGRLLRAAALRQTGKPTEALAELGMCVRARPEFAWPHLLRASLHLKRGQLAAAAADLDAASGLELDDSSRYVLLLNRGLLSLARGDAAEATREFQRAILTSPRRYNAFANLADALARADDSPGALAALDHAVRLEPAHAGLLRCRARLLREMKDYSAALRDLDRARELEPNDPRDRSDRARLLYQARRYSEALSASDEALAAAPGDAGALRVRAESLLNLGRHAEAATAFDRYLAKGKPDVEAYRRRAQARAGINDFAGVVTDYTLALEISKETPLYLGRGWAQLVRSEPRAAVGDFNDALRLSPGDAEALIGRGAAKADLKERAAAVADLEAGLRAQPKSPRVLFAAARSLARLSSAPRRDRDLERRALDALRRAVEATPPDDREKFFRQQVRPETSFNHLRAEIDALQKQPAR